MMRNTLAGLLALATAGGATAAEVTVKNDSLTDFGTAIIVTGFISGGAAGSWLTSPCAGNIVAVQVFWRSQSGTAAPIIHEAVRIHRAGTFPTPGVVVETVGGPVLTDGVLNEWRYTDENSVIPILVPVAQDETFVVALTFDEAPPLVVGPSVVRDTNGILPGRNSIYSNFGAGFEWRSAESLGVAGDWVIRAVVDCQAASTEADVAVGLAAHPSAYTAGAPLAYTLVVSNAGPAAAPGTTVVDLFPAAFTGATWTCAATGGASCAAAGSGNITQLVNLPPGGQVVFNATGTVAPGTLGPIANTATAVLGAGLTDPVPGNNTDSVVVEPDNDLIFAHGFE
ncbi:MAG: DUF11 domain-containing protein [Xanthomonadales bacterium]|nr:DUF11 domain-containing protein [Xanthomonadales bacterium]